MTLMSAISLNGSDQHAHQFEVERTEERWEIGAGEPRLVELRSERGESTLERTSAGLFITASSSESVPKSSDYGGRAERLLARVFDLLPGPQQWRLRRVRSLRKVTIEDESFAREEHYVSLRSDRGLGIVVPFSDAIDLEIDRQLDRLTVDGEGTEVFDPEVPILWTAGTGSILFHESLGHPAEVGASPLRWPDWLRVVDDPSGEGLGAMESDDIGLAVHPADLTAGEIPTAFRREGYRDSPLRRMTSLRVELTGPEVEPPPDRIEVQHLGGGEWDPVTDRVAIRVTSAIRVRAGRRRTLHPFLWIARRGDVPGSLMGAVGPTKAYPGVLCRDEGQRIPVGSASPDILTRRPR
jgi:hypothetical protein